MIASEILEHIPDDGRAVAELARVLKPGGSLAVTVPAGCPNGSAGCSRTPTTPTRAAMSGSTGPNGCAPCWRPPACGSPTPTTRTRCTSPYWWLKCAVGVDNDDNVLVRGYHRMLVWDMMSAPVLTRAAEAALNPLIGKSVALYFREARPQEDRHRQDQPGGTRCAQSLTSRACRSRQGDHPGAVPPDRAVHRSRSTGLR